MSPSERAFEAQVEAACRDAAHQMDARLAQTPGAVMTEHVPGPVTGPVLAQVRRVLSGPVLACNELYGAAPVACVYFVATPGYLHRLACAADVRAALAGTEAGRAFSGCGGAARRSQVVVTTLGRVIVGMTLCGACKARELGAVA